MGKRLRITIVLALASIAGVARADEADAARRAFEEGTALEKRGEYEAALARFRESATQRPTAGNRFHVGYCLEMTGKLAAALVEYDAVTELARDQKKPEILAATTTRLEGLRPRVPRLTLKATLPPGGEVLVDGNLVTDLTTPVPVDPGPHIVTADAPEHEGFKKTVDLPEKSNVTVDVVLAKLVIAGAKPVVAPRPAPPDHTAAIAATAGAVVLVGAGIASFLVAGSAKDDGEAQCAVLAAPTCDKNQTRVRAFDALALGGWIAGAGLGAVAVWLWTTKPARVGINGTGLRLEGRF